MEAQFLRRRKSALIDGAGDNARDLSEHLTSYLNSRVHENGLDRQGSLAVGANNSSIFNSWRVQWHYRPFGRSRAVRAANCEGRRCGRPR
jgi:hypothetical protein